MKYLVFLYDYYDAAGGWRDLQTKTSTLHEAIKHVVDFTGYANEFDIVNIANCKMIISGQIFALRHIVSGTAPAGVYRMWAGEENILRRTAEIFFGEKSENQKSQHLHGNAQ